MIRARLALLIVIVLAFVPPSVMEARAGHGTEVAARYSTLRAPTGHEPGGNRFMEADTGTAEATPEPRDADDLDPIPAGDGDLGGKHASSRSDLPSRLLSREPGPLTLWIILPGDAFVVGENDTCVGTGGFAGLRPGAVVSLLDASAGAAHIESVMIEATGGIYFDTVLQQDVCAFDLAFSRVVPGTSVLVDLDRIVLGRFDHIAPADDSGGPPVYAIVAGE